MTRDELNSFADALSGILPTIMREFLSRISSEFSKANLTFPQVLILESLHRDGPMTMSALARNMVVTGAAVTGLVERLVKCGYATREFDETDRRIIRVKLTSKGSELVKLFNARRREIVLKTFSGISFADRKNYLRIITRIRDILINERDETI